MLTTLPMRASILVAMLLACSGNAFSQFGQNIRGGIRGIVTDQTGSVVPGCAVKATNVATALEYNTTTTTAGEYSLNDLPVGAYNVVAIHTGFSTITVNGVTVTGGQTYNLPIALQVATTASSVEVSASALALQTTDTTLVSTLPTTAVQDMPMNTRDFTQLIATVPGCAGKDQNGGCSINGSRSSEMTWEMEGSDDNDPWWNLPATNQTGLASIAAVVVPLDAIEEFNVVTQGDTQMGRTGGATVNLILKSGTNQVHGDVYDFERNEGLAARPPFLGASLHKPEVRNRNYGGSVGGPIWKNRTFFFGAYEAQKFVFGASALTTEPTLAYQQQALSLLNRFGVAENPVSATLLNTLWPSFALTGPGTSNNYLANSLQPGYSHNGMIKIDHSFNNRWRLSLRAYAAYGFQLGSIGDQLPYYFAQTPVHSQNYNANLNTIVNPHITNQLLYSGNYFDLKKEDANTSFKPPALGLNTGVTAPDLSGAPFINMTGFDLIGSTPIVGRDTVANSGSDTLTYIKGSHQFTFGGGASQGLIDGFYHAGERGNFYFNGSQGPWHTLIGTPGFDSNVATLADFMAGDVYQSNIAIGNPERFVTLNSFFFYAQDHWQVTRNLNLNYGLRYEYVGPVHDSNQDLSEFDPAVAGGLAVAGQQIPNLYQRYWPDFLPRGGFAYQAHNGLVIRGGVGLYVDTVPILPFLNNSNSLASYGAPNGGPIGVNGNPAGKLPVYAVQRNAYTIVPNQLLFPTVPTATGTNVINLFGVNPQLRPGEVLGFNLQLEKSLGKNIIVDVGYVGTQSRHLLTLQDINQAALGSGTALAPSGFTNAQISRPYFSRFPNFGVINTVESNGDANYNGLQTQFRTTSWHGLFTKANFTWSHNLDDMTANSGNLPQNSFNLRGDYGTADNNHGRQFNGSFVYQIPAATFGPKWLMSGWELSSLMQFFSGAPINPHMASDTTGTGENVLRPNYVAGVDPYTTGSHSVVNHQPVHWLNPAAFAAPAPGTFGALGRGVLTGPGFGSADVSVIKQIPIKESLHAEVHVDMFNIFNRVNFGGVNSTVGSSSFGTIGSTTGGSSAAGIGPGEPFNMQIGLKMLW